MFSELFTLGPITVHTYGFCMAMGFLLAWHFIGRMCKRNGQDANFYSSLTTWLLVSAILGARIAYVIEHWDAEFAQNPMAVFRIDRGGLMFYGGFIGATLFTLVYARYQRKKIFEISDVLLTVLPLGHMFGRIGCFFHGCCYGGRTDSFLGVSFPANSPAWFQQLEDGLITRSASETLPVLPVQLIEAALNLLVFAVLYRMYFRAFRHRGLITAIYLISYASVRFITECLRGDERFAVAGFSIGQTISVIIFCVGGAIYFCRRKSTAS